MFVVCLFFYVYVCVVCDLFFFVCLNVGVLWRYCFFVCSVFGGCVFKCLRLCAFLCVVSCVMLMCLCVRLLFCF